MAFINVAEWTPGNVADWLKGLEDAILPYVQFFLNNNLNGCKLLLLTTDDLEQLNVRKIGHQEIILEGVDQLKHLHYDFASETLQSQALRLGCRARSLFNQLKSEDCNPNQDRVSTSTLSSVSDILLSVKSFISWIDRYPFSAQDTYLPVRESVLRRSIELASTAQRDQFVEKPNEVLKDSCAGIASLCDKIVQELNDSLAITPASLEVVGIKKKYDEDLGLQIYSSYCGVHLVGGILDPSPSSRCLRIEEGDEIVQIKYQTVVGWQLKNLVNAMKECPTEILLTLKKRPRHSPYAGHAVVLKPQKLRRPHSRTQINPTPVPEERESVNSEDEENFEVSYKQTQLKGPVHQVPPRRPKLPLRRRATISGGSPTAVEPPFRVDDLIPSARKDHLGRSISHDVSSEKEHKPPSKSFKQLPPIPTKSSSHHPSAQVPHARVQPLPATLSRQSKVTPSETFPKQLVGQHGNVYDQVPYDMNEEGMKSRPGQNVGVVIPNHTNKPEVSSSDAEKPPPLPLRSSSSVKKIKEKASRRISFKSLGPTDYQGWLLQRKDVQGYLVPTTRWTKRWVVLKQSLLFCFKTPDSMKADCLISLPGFVVAPASDGKPRKYSFRVYNLTTSFYFASDTVGDMSKWINKIGFAAISYSSTLQSVDEAFFSETDSSDQEADYINDHETYSTATTIPRNQSRQVLRNNSTASAVSSSSSIHVPVVASIRVADRRIAHPVRTPVGKSQASITNPDGNTNCRRNSSVSSLGSECQENYVKLAYPPPSPTTRKPMPPASPESPRKYVELAQMEETVNEKPPLPEKGINVLSRARREPPTPIPRVSKLKEKFESADTLPIPCAKRPLIEPKSIDQLLNSSDALLNPVYNHVIPKDQGTRLAVAVDPDIFANASSPESGPMTMLDREYNRLFGDKSPLELNRCVPPRTSTDVVSSIYGITTNASTKQEQMTASTLPRSSSKYNPYSSSLNRSQSPVSDKSCSSSSGISSTHSIFLGSSTNSRLEVPPKNDVIRDDVFISQELELDAKSKTPVKSNSFRLLSSPRLSKRLSTPKHHKGRRQEKKDGKSPDETKSTSGFFKVSRSLASVDPSKGLRRSNSINRSCSDSVIRPFTVRSHSAERAARPRLSDQQSSSETLGKPTMGVAMMKIKRESSVSSDRSVIESVLSRFPEDDSRYDLEPNSPDTEEECINILRGLKKFSPCDPVDKTKNAGEEEVSCIVGNLRSYQNSLKERNKEKEVIDDLLKEPITLTKLQSWLKAHPSMLQ